ncbi:winged helix DNA-binding domain-containing protein [Cellulomonas marina]|uniref:Winged helix DNA-binding domain-containing protein n=1 Tax=Cellulomonas marina TaxID=988821 RepID=A0A1I0V0L9_9CELL|nr:winged helix DNA-binding domain-containing protein [Cellulomonas marina]GIG29885.1 hypothetical protein Cma02nite_24850 [Cellulomonas marina]SFA69577.1 Winged helix DNA-binding domain-containing protein [Cellulomonas marina]
MDEPLTTRVLGRTLLARQHLLARTDADPLSVVGHLIGFQSQNPSSPYGALWARVVGFTHAALADATADGRVLRLAVVRSTVHAVLAQDAAALAVVSAPRLERDLLGTADRRAGLAGTDLAAVARDARELLAAAPLTAAELGPALAARGHAGDPAHLAMVARCLLPLVQVPPRGVWRSPARTRWRPLDVPAGLEEPDVRRAALEGFVERYLAAYGPASVADLQTWSGLTGLRAVVDGMRERLVVRRTAPGVGTAAGRELLDVPGAALAPGDVPAPVRLLPDFDDVLLSHADRTRVVPTELRPHLASRNGMPPATVLVDGVVAGAWRVVRERTGARGARRERAVLHLQPWCRWTAAQRAEAVDEAGRAVRFWADDADEHAVVLDEGP